MNILLIGPDPAAKGGIATVIHNFQKAQAPEDVRFIIHTTWSEKENIGRSSKRFLPFVGISKKKGARSFISTLRKRAVSIARVCCCC